MKRLLSVVTPAFNEASNLPELHRRLTAALAGVEWEWIVIDDHSTDDTFAIIARLAKDDARVQGVRLTRNFGSHAAMACGLARARGKAALVLAADLQEPPEIVTELLARWREGAQVVWAVRDGPPPDQGLIGRSLSGLYYLAMRRLAGLQDLPPPGADGFLLDRAVLDGIGQFDERHTSLHSLLAWAGYRQSHVVYQKQARLSGQSGWTMRKKIKLLVDSVTTYSYAPLRTMSALGAITALAGFVYAAVVVANAFSGHPVAGWSSLMVVVLVLGGLQMLMLGVLGEYLWRALDESRRRPRYLIQETVGDPKSNA